MIGVFILTLITSLARNEGGQLNGGTAWYRKTFTLNEADKNKGCSYQF